MGLFKNKQKPNELDTTIGYKLVKKSKETVRVDVPFLAESRFDHTLIVGSAGSGKTFKILTPMVLKDISIKSKPVGVTVMEPWGSFAEETYLAAKEFNKNIDDAIKAGSYTKETHGDKKIIQYFNPKLDNCPYFNPLEGNIDNVVENIANAFLLFNTGMAPFTRDTCCTLIKNAVKIAKRLYGDEATFFDLEVIICNPENRGLKNYVIPFGDMLTDFNGEHLNAAQRKEREEIVNWFINDYYLGMDLGDKAPKTFRNSQIIRDQITKLNTHKYLRKILNPPHKGSPNYQEYLKFQEECKKNETAYKLDIFEAIDKGHVLAITTSVPTLRVFGNLLGYFLMLQIQTAILSRSGNEDSRIENMIYIDDFQNCANNQFIEVLRTAKTYKVAFHLAMQSRYQFIGDDNLINKNFADILFAHAKNRIVFSKLSYLDAEYFLKEYLSFFEKKNAIKKSPIKTRGDILEIPDNEILYSLTTNGMSTPFDRAYTLR